MRRRAVSADIPRSVRSAPKDGSPGTLRRPGAEPTVRSSRAPEVSGPAQSRAIRQRPASPASARGRPAENEGHGAERLPPARVVPAELRLRPVPPGPVAGAPEAVPADLDARDAHVRRLGGDGVPGRGARLERAALPRLVPDRRRLGGRLAGPGHDVPAREDALRLRRGALGRAGRPLHVPLLAQERLPRQRHLPVPLPADRGRRGGGDRRRDLPGEGPLGQPGGRADRGRDAGLHPDGGCSRRSPHRATPSTRPPASPAASSSPATSAC